MVEPISSISWQLAIQNGLISIDQFQESWEALSTADRSGDGLDRLIARQAVASGHLTAWQAQQIVLGRAARLVIDRYQLLDSIGQGGMGRVFLALDSRLGRRVALKLLTTSRISDASAISRFRREARLGAQLQQENLVRIYDDGEIRGQVYLVMEYIEGWSVARLLNDHGPIPWATAARLAREVALGLEHLRIKGMVHRDVNPANILVNHDGLAKLADLGLAIERDDSQVMTEDGSFLGNYDYVAPEQAGVPEMPIRGAISTRSAARSTR